jgi:class 3 adenylate cyclase
VVLNERQDYFGQTVNIASRVQGLADSQSIYATGGVVEHGDTAALLREGGIVATSQQLPIRGISSEVLVYQIP